MPTLPRHSQSVPATTETLGGMAPTVDINDVELVATGVWRASTGNAPITRADLESCLRAATDREIDHAPIHLGHTDARFPALSQDGEPALGWVVPERIVDTAMPDGTVQSKLLGRMKDVPAKWAAIIPRAYRRRSVEMNFGVKTPSGVAYPATLTGLGLLGVKAPAVKSLADIEARYSAEFAAIDTPENAERAVAFAFGDALDTPQSTVPADLPNAVGQSESITAETGGTSIMARLTDDQLRALIGATPDADITAIRASIDAVVPEPVAEPIAPVAPEVAVTPPLPTASVAPVEPVPVAVPAPVAQEFVLPAGYTLAPIPNFTSPVATEVREPIAASAPGVVSISADQLAQLQAGAAAGAAALAAMDTARRDHIVNESVSLGRISLSEAPAWRTALDVNEGVNAPLLTSLVANRIPVEPVGHSAAFGAGDVAGADAAAAEAAWLDFENATFPELREQRARAAAHAPIAVVPAAPAAG